jgi:hypothetical protein
VYGVLGFFAANLVSTRGRRAGTEEMPGATRTPVSARVLATCLATVGPAVVTAVVTGVALLAYEARDYLLPQRQAGEPGGRDRAAPRRRRDRDHVERLGQGEHGRFAGVAVRHLHAQQRQRLQVAIDLRRLARTGCAPSVLTEGLLARSAAGCRSCEHSGAWS